MKRAVSCTLMALLLIALLPWAAANSAPTRYTGGVYGESLAVDEDCPVTVLSETLVFDQIGQAGSYDLTARVTARYRMHNPTDTPLSVPMAFALEDVPAQLDLSAVSVTADGEALPLHLYAGETVYPSYTPARFDPAAEGFLYTFTPGPGREETEEDVTITFPADAVAVVQGCSAYGWQDDGRPQLVIAPWDDAPITLFSFEELDYQVTGECAVETRPCAFAGFFGDWLADLPWARQYPDFSEDVERMNLQWLDRWLEGQNCVFLEELEQTAQSRQQLQLAYTVDFPAGGEREVTVTYRAGAQGSRTDTRYWKSTFTYLLSPARHWADFGTLEVEVHTPESAPYVIDSTLPLEQAEEGLYTARLEGLPEEELSFTLYPTPSVTLGDRLSRLADKLPYLVFFLPILVPVLIVILILCLAVPALARRRRARERGEK